jgi:hypothetical protein
MSFTEDKKSVISTEEKLIFITPWDNFKKIIKDDLGLICDTDMQKLFNYLLFTFKKEKNNQQYQMVCHMGTIKYQEGENWNDFGIYLKPECLFASFGKNLKDIKLLTPNDIHEFLKTYLFLCGYIGTDILHMVKQTYPYDEKSGKYQKFSVETKLYNYTLEENGIALHLIDFRCSCITYNGEIEELYKPRRNILFFAKSN